MTTSSRDGPRRGRESRLRAGRLGPAPLCLGVLLAVTVAPSVPLADGGVVRKRVASGAFVITVLTAPEPLRAGPAEITVLVQARDDEETILDADVELRLTPPSSLGESKVVRAMRGEEASKLLYAAAIELPIAGVWSLTVTVRAVAGRAEVSCDLPVAPRASTLVRIWPYLAAPPVAIALFALHQWLKQRRGHANPAD